MGQYITRIRTDAGDLQIDYNALANLPDIQSAVDHTHTPESIGAAPADHEHKTSDITDFPASLPANGGNADTVGGKSVSDFASASDVEQLKTKINNASFDMSNVMATTEELNYVKGVTSNIQQQLNLKAQLQHNHKASDITEGTFNIDRIPSISMEKGGTNASNGAEGLANLFAAGMTVLSSHQYGNDLPEPGNVGRIFFKKVVR
jgi:hypothetical protein